VALPVATTADADSAYTYYITYIVNKIWIRKHRIKSFREVTAGTAAALSPGVREGSAHA
jgi:hypothetical protein